MRQLSPRDAAFLDADNAHANANLTFVQIYDQGTAPGGSVRFKAILAHIESRLQRWPLFRHRLLQVPLGLDEPYWVEDAHFDLEYHVRHIALPAPGDWRQFCIQASRIHARALDLDRPLWEIYVIEGLDSITDLPPGSFALLTKIHHAAIPIETRNEVIEVLHDGRRRPPRPPPPRPWFPERAPGGVELLGRSLVHCALAPQRLLRPLARLRAGASTFAHNLLHADHETAIRFNSVVSPHRVFDTRRFGVDEFDAIRRLVPGASIDDAVLAVCAGGLRAYLEAQGELPPADLNALTLRAGEAVTVSLATSIADPVERLRWIQAGSEGTAASATPQADRPLAAFSLTPVAGPQRPVYLAGARLVYYSAILPIADGLGLAFAVTRYDGRIVISPTSCRELMPDPEAFTQCVRDCFQDYLARATGRAAAPVQPLPLKPAAPGASASGRRRPAAPKPRKAASPLRLVPGGQRRSTARPR
ncbi:MAG: DUF1298 domain-containing protein [Burkholderiales bacterium]|nr:DUF1298 domain-containing protein [Burkholderiales bacterium]